jgi:hypothetical protein
VLVCARVLAGQAFYLRLDNSTAIHGKEKVHGLHQVCRWVHARGSQRGSLIHRDLGHCRCCAQASAHARLRGVLWNVCSNMLVLWVCALRRCLY